jgi:hypothetical protein
MVEILREVWPSDVRITQNTIDASPIPLDAIKNFAPA